MTCFWLFFVVIMVAAYTGNLFSFITFPSMLPAIDTFQVKILLSIELRQLFHKLNLQNCSMFHRKDATLAL